MKYKYLQQSRGEVGKKAGVAGTGERKAPCAYGNVQ